MRYLYSVVRYVPDPVSGEFVNMGAIAGSETRGDWSTRHASQDKRALAIGRADSLGALYSFLAEIQEKIELREFALDADDELTGPEFSEAWLMDLFHRCRNIVQLSRPAPMSANSAEEALDSVFDQMIRDAVVEHRPYATRPRVFSNLRAQYQRLSIDASLVRRKVRLRVGSLYTPLDFVIGQDRAVQIAQTWSFQLAGIQDVAKDIKSWGYTVRELREHPGMIVGDNVTVPSDVDVEVLYAPPTNNEQEQVLNEALRVFSDVEANPVEDSDADSIASKAARSLAAVGLLGQLGDGNQ